MKEGGKHVGIHYGHRPGNDPRGAPRVGLSGAGGGGHQHRPVVHRIVELEELRRFGGVVLEGHVDLAELLAPMAWVSIDLHDHLES